MSKLQSIVISSTNLPVCDIFVKGKTLKAPAITLTTSYTLGEDGYFGATVQLRYASITFRYSPIASKVMFFITKTCGKIDHGVTIKYEGNTLKIYGWSKGKVTGSGITAYRKFNSFRDFIADKDYMPKNFFSEVTFFQAYCLQQLEAAAKPWVKQAPLVAHSNEKGMWNMNKFGEVDGMLLRMLYPCFDGYHVEWVKTNQSVGFGKYSVDSPKQLAQNILGISGKQAVNAVVAKAAEAREGFLFCNSEAYKFYTKLKGWSPEQKLVLFDRIGFNVDGRWLKLVAAIGSPQRCLDKITAEEARKFTITDSVVMLNQLWSRHKVIAEWVKDLKTPDMFHNYLSHIVNNIKSTDIKLWRNPEFTQFDGVKVAGMKLIQPKLESTIKRWGAELGICVGGYESRINSGQSAVFGLVDEQDRIQVCIEVARQDSYTVTQVFGYRNSGQSPELCKEIANVFKLDMKLKAFGQFNGFNYKPKEVVIYKLTYSNESFSKHVVVEVDEAEMKTLMKNALYNATRPGARYQNLDNLDF